MESFFSPCDIVVAGIKTFTIRFWFFFLLIWKQFFFLFNFHCYQFSHFILYRQQRIWHENKLNVTLRRAYTGIYSVSLLLSFEILFSYTAFRIVYRLCEKRQLANKKVDDISNARMMFGACFFLYFIHSAFFALSTFTQSSNKLYER